MSYKYSANSQKHYDELHPDLQAILIRALKVVDHSVVDGHRPPEEQLIAYNKGNSKVKFGKHNLMPAEAVDVQPYPLSKDAREKREQFYWLAGILYGIGKTLFAEGIISHDVRFGGDWDKDGDITDNNFDDLYHLELIKPKK